MQRWQCNHEGCRTVAMGICSAIGLRAIGWYVIKEKQYCPVHHPHGYDDAQRETTILQEIIREETQT